MPSTELRRDHLPGFLERLRGALDHEHPERWAPAPGVTDLLERARADATPEAR